MGGVRSMRSAVTAFAMATAHLANAAAGADRRWATDRGEGSPRSEADMRIQVGSGAAVLGRTGGGILPPGADPRRGSRESCAGAMRRSHAPGA
jgi:hypothetical protein